MMKYMMKAMTLLPLVLLMTILSPAGAAENFYDDYSDSERLVIAGAYLAVGDQYEALGEEEKGKAFQNLADRIFPGIESTPLPAQGEEPNLSSVETAAPMRPSGKEPAAVQYYFGKLLRSIFSEDQQGVASLLTTRLYLPGYDEGVKKEDALAFTAGAFKRYELEKIDPSELYELGRIYIRPEGSAWSAGIKPSDKGRRIFEDEFGIRGEMHKFYFREYREGWRLIALNAE